MLKWQRWGKSPLTKTRVLLSTHDSLDDALKAVPATIRTKTIMRKAESPYVFDFIHEAIELVYQ